VIFAKEKINLYVFDTVVIKLWLLLEGLDLK